MRILHVTHNFPRWEGDFSGVFLQSLAREQVAHGHDVTVLAPHAAGASERAVESGIKVHRFRYGTDLQETIAYNGTLHDALRSSWAARWRFLHFLAAEWRATRRLARELRPDAVHVHWWFPNGLAAAWPLRPAGARRVVITAHGTDVFLLRKMAWLRPLARRVFRAADAVAAVSGALAADVRSLGVPVVHVIPMPLDWVVHGGPAGEAGTRDAGHMLFVGRLSAQKGATYLVEALARLRASRPEVRLTIVGDGPERPALQAQAAALAVAGSVDFVGTRSPTEVAALYRRATVLAIPATTGRGGEREGFGLVAVEAMLASLPVVATASGGLVDIVEDGKTGLLVADADAAALATALARVLDDRALAEAMGTRGRASALERFAPAALARAYVALYISPDRPPFPPGAGDTSAPSGPRTPE